MAGSESECTKTKKRHPGFWQQALRLLFLPLAVPFLPLDRGFRLPPPLGCLPPPFDRLPLPPLVG